MPPPGVLLDLALTLHPSREPEEQEHAARLAARLGYTEVWLAVGSAGGGAADWPEAERLEALTAAARPARVGLVLPDDPDEAEAGLLALPPRPPDGAFPGGPLLEASGPTEGLVQAVGGARTWRALVRLPTFDPAAAGTVIRPVHRAATVSAGGRRGPRPDRRGPDRGPAPDRRRPPGLDREDRQRGGGPGAA